jgi:hypothetical protein
MKNAEDRYTTWIHAYLERVQNTLGRCREACVEMRAAFPELIEVRGHVLDLQWGRRGHIWLVTPDKTIIDPTASQFPALYEYEPWTPDQPVRVGRCMNCGEEIWERVPSLDVEVSTRSVCSDACERELMAEYS